MILNNYYERQGKIISRNSREGGKVLQLRYEGRTAEHHGSGHTGEEAHRECFDVKMYSREPFGECRLHHFLVCVDDAQVTASHTAYDETRPPVERDFNGIQDSRKTVKGNGGQGQEGGRGKPTGRQDGMLTDRERNKKKIIQMRSCNN